MDKTKAISAFCWLHNMAGICMACFVVWALYLDSVSLYTSPSPRDGLLSRLAGCGVNAVTTQNKTMNTSPMMVVTAHYCLSLINHHLFTLLYFSKICQLLCIYLTFVLGLFDDFIIWDFIISSHLYRAAAYAVWQNHCFVFLQSK